MSHFVVTAEHSGALFQSAGLILLFALLSLLIWCRAAMKGHVPGHQGPRLRNLLVDNDEPPLRHLNADDL